MGSSRFLRLLLNKEQLTLYSCALEADLASKHAMIGSAHQPCLRSLAGTPERLHRSVHHHRVLREAGVAVERVFDFFLRRRFLLPSKDLLLKELGPRAVEIDLFARALVHDFKAVARHVRYGRGARVGLVVRDRSRVHCLRQHVYHYKGFGVVEHVHDGSPNRYAHHMTAS